MKTTVSRAPVESTVASAKLKIASLLPRVGITSVSGSSATPKRRDDPRRNRLAQLRQTDRGRIAHPVAQSVDECLPDQRVGRLARIAGAEVDHAHAACLNERSRLCQTHERIRRLALEDGGERHG